MDFPIHPYNNLFLTPIKFDGGRSLLFLQGKVSKQVTNGSKIAVMDVIGSLCVPLGSSAVQLHDSLGSRSAWACSEAGFSSKNGDRA
jgi:hypothetical protein